MLFFQLELNYGIRTSPIQFCLWLFLSSLHIINVYCEIIGYYYFQEEGSDLVSLISSILQIVLFLSCFTCHFFSESQSDYQSPTEGQGNLFWGIDNLICVTSSLRIFKEVSYHKVAQGKIVKVTKMQMSNCHIQLKLQLWIILLPFKLCDTEKSTYLLDNI